MNGDNGPKKEPASDDEDDFFDEEYEDWFDAENPPPLAVDEFFQLSLYDPRRWAKRDDED